MVSHMPSSTCLPSNSTSRVPGDSAAWAVMVLRSPDFPPPGSPPGQDRPKNVLLET